MVSNKDPRGLFKKYANEIIELSKEKDFPVPLDLRMSKQDILDRIEGMSAWDCVDFVIFHVNEIHACAPVTEEDRYNEPEPDDIDAEAYYAMHRGGDYWNV